MEDFLAMGGYARYVWPSYGLVLLALIVHVALPMLRKRRLLDEIRREREASR